MESFPRWLQVPEGEQEQVSAESLGSEGNAKEHEQFGWNDVIVSDDAQDAAEKIIKDLGFTSKNKELSKKQYLDEKKQAWAPGEILLSITYPNDNKPVDRETLRQIMVALKEGKKHIAVRVARLAPGERFG